VRGTVHSFFERRLGVNRSHLVRQNHALTGSPGGRDFQIVARAIGPPSMSRDGHTMARPRAAAMHQQTQPALDGDLLFMTDRRIGIHFQDVPSDRDT